MDVDTKMKTLFFLSLLLFPVSLYAEPLIISNTQLEIDNQCRLKATNKEGESKLIELKLPESPNCKFHKYYDTNMIHLERISNSYMFFIEMIADHDVECISKYTAVVIKNDGVVVPSGMYSPSGTCPPNLEMKQFLSSAYEMKILK